MSRYDSDEEPVASDGVNCPNCDLAQSQWSNKKQGYMAAGETYCCEDCAEDRGCLCPGEEDDTELTNELNQFEKENSTRRRSN